MMHTRPCGAGALDTLAPSGSGEDLILEREAVLGVLIDGESAADGERVCRAVVVHLGDTVVARLDPRLGDAVLVAVREDRTNRFVVQNLAHGGATVREDAEVGRVIDDDTVRVV